jgi:hypothetical protein
MCVAENEDIFITDNKETLDILNFNYENIYKWYLLSLSAFSVLSLFARAYISRKCIYV